MRASLRSVVLSIVLVGGLVFLATAQTTIPIQGNMTNGSGVPVDSTLPMLFKLYNGGIAIWNETHPAVQIVDGVYSVQLGSITPLSTLSFWTGLQLGITVGGDSELAPRTLLGTSPTSISLINLRVREVDGDKGTSVNLIGGFVQNSDSTGVEAATISGGGLSDMPNKVNADGGTISGGWDNIVGGETATISGGESHRATGPLSTIGGGMENSATAQKSTVAGGENNNAGGDYASITGGLNNNATATRATVGGGEGNGATGQYATIVGGLSNIAASGRTFVGGGESNSAIGGFSTITGGFDNNATGAKSFVAGGEANLVNADWTTVGGGQSNTASGQHATVGGGQSNTASGQHATVGGGFDNTASGERSFIGGGSSNVSSSTNAIVVGGSSNQATALGSVIIGGTNNVASDGGAAVIGSHHSSASGDESIILGGQDNHVSGDGGAVLAGLFNQVSGERSVTLGGEQNNARGDFSLAAGKRAKANHSGSFVWNDNAAGTFADSFGTTKDFQFLIKASGGVGIGENQTFTPLHVTKNNIGVSADDVFNDVILAEDADATIGIYSNPGGTWGSGINLVEMTSCGVLPCAPLPDFENMWSIVRTTSGGGNSLSFRFGTSTNYASNSGKLAIHENGDVQIVGALSKGSGSFKIDHPLDPENKYLYHSFVESPDMMNVYNGNVILDASGEAAVEMPAYFEALNRDFRYQLTAIGAPGPNLFIADEITDGAFRIAGGSPGMKVSWLVTGVRQDPYAEMHPIIPEVEKPIAEKGTYLHPEAYGRLATSAKLEIQNAE